MKHGTRWCYDNGCNHRECREAAQLARKKARDEARALNRPSYQRKLAMSRAYKQRQRGRCRVCGAETRYNGSRINGPSECCLPCAAKERGEKIRGSGPVEQKVLAVIADGTDCFSDIAAVVGISMNHMSSLLNQLLRYGLVERVARGRYRVVKQRVRAA